VDDNIDSGAAGRTADAVTQRVAHDGAAAVRLTRLRPTIVVLDLECLIVDGYDAARQIRADAGAPTLCWSRSPDSGRRATVNARNTPGSTCT
jgi:DNA-binding response OmpR family regulator